MKKSKPEKSSLKISENFTELVNKKTEDNNQALKIGGLYLPEKTNKQSMSVRSYRISNEKYDKLYKICSKSSYSVNEVLNSLIDVFIQQNEKKLNG